eukprot:scaffold897_cov402-Prasinococcus_capsulatus_cf.AAC.48
MLRDVFKGIITDAPHTLKRVHETFGQALTAFSNANDWANYALVHANLAKMMRIRVAKGIPPDTETSAQATTPSKPLDCVSQKYANDWRLSQYSAAASTCEQGLRRLARGAAEYEEAKAVVQMEQAAAYLSQGVYIMEYVNSAGLAFHDESRFVTKALEMMDKAVHVYEGLSMAVCREPAATAQYHLGMGLSRCVQSKQREQYGQIPSSTGKGCTKAKDGDVSRLSQKQRLQTTLPLRHLEKALEFFSADLYPTDHVRIRIRMAEIHIQGTNPERALYLLSGAAEVTRHGVLASPVADAIQEAVVVVHIAFQALLRSSKGARHRRYKEMYSHFPCPDSPALTLYFSFRQLQTGVDSTHLSIAKTRCGHGVQNGVAQAIFGPLRKIDACSVCRPHQTLQVRPNLVQLAVCEEERVEDSMAPVHHVIVYGDAEEARVGDNAAQHAAIKGVER